jgi:hypothetical protein
MTKMLMTEIREFVICGVTAQDLFARAWACDVKCR